MCPSTAAESAAPPTGDSALSPWRLGWAAVALWGSLALLWLGDVAGGAHLPWVGRALAVAAILASGSWIIVYGVEGWRAGGERRRATVSLAVLLALALAVRFTGIAHEASGHYYLDEGTYYHHATAIAAGNLLSKSFVYPHLTYYADAFALWLAGLFPGAVAGLAARLWGLTQPVDVDWVLLRSVVALLGALSVVPVFTLARRFGGLAAGTAGGLLLALSPLHNAGSHLNTCDIPAAFFAAVCIALSARLLDGESARGYLLAGAAAGFAAGAKYPAGFAALAIVAVYLSWRVARHPLVESRLAGRLGLLWAGLAALAAFLATTPSLLAFPHDALYGGKGIFFGVRQYGKGGWIGVVPGSNGRFYLDNLIDSFGLPAIVAGMIGLVLLWMSQRERRRALLWLIPFPVVFWLLITAMSMVVKRNLYPLLPVIAAYLGAGLAAWLEPGLGLLRGPDRGRSTALRAAAAVLVLACLLRRRSTR